MTRHLRFGRLLAVVTALAVLSAAAIPAEAHHQAIGGHLSTTL